MRANNKSSIDINRKILVKVFKIKNLWRKLMRKILPLFAILSVVSLVSC